MTTMVPDGYKQNGRGHLVPVEQIKDVDLMRDEVVCSLVGKAMECSATIEAFKRQIMGDVQAFLDLSAERYQVQHGGAKGNVQLSSFDGQFQVRREVSDRIEFDERLQAAKTLVDQCMQEWTREASVEVQALINLAFATDRKGKINTQRILELRKLKIDHPKWALAMEAINDAINVVESSTYYRFYRRDEQGKYQQIPLDFSVL